MTSSLLDQHRYTISDFKLLNPPVARRRHHKPIINIAKITDTDSELLESVEGIFDKNQIVWSEQTLYNVTAESIINFKILMRNGKEGTFETIGECTTTVTRLLNSQRSYGICFIPILCKVTLVNQKSQLSLTFKEDRFKDMLDKAKQQNAGIYFAGGESWSTFLTYFGIIKTVVDSVASLNPYAKQVWSILSIVPNVAQMHVTRNKKVKKLWQRLMDVFKYINEADRLPVLKDTQSDKLKLLIDKTCDCADFIKKYTENNAADNAINGPRFDDRISEFEDAFDQIFKTIEHSLMIEIASNIDVSRLLGDIPYADNVGLDHEKICLPGTCQNVIRKILEWVDKEDTSERVLILSGHAGTGKSAVAHTIAKTLNDRLGSFFCFNISNKGNINFLFSTISRNLADRDDLWRRNLVQAIKDITIRKSSDPTKQFEEMIIKPSIGTTKRMVIIIDALDESGDQTEREILLNLLFERSSELPRNYRIIITSRPEDDIAQFHQHSNVFCKYMADVNPTDTLNDIHRFISSELSKVATILDAENKNWPLLLAQKAQGLFQWAKIACGYILELGELEAARRLRTVLIKPTSSLYEMYHQILDSQPSCQYDSYLTLLKTCVGAVIVSRKPLSVSALQAFFGPICGDSKNVKVVLKSLNSLLIGTTESTAELRPIHTSLFDFFVNPEQAPGTPNRYYIDTADQSSFTYACLGVMTRMLRFNICGLETSHLRNRDIPNLDSRVAEAIPSHLSYACCFWAYHLENSRLNPDLLEKINDLMRNKLLYFFEVLSLLGKFDDGSVGMQILRNKTKDKNSELAAWAAEASQFAFEFGDIIMESTPHLYLSFLPYISNNSFISQQFLPRYPQLLSMDVGQPLDLQPGIKDSIAQRHPWARPIAVAFSPQGRQIACAFESGDLWVWDYITGEMISRVGPKGKPSAVCKIAFSLNGELVYCCFEDGSILTWEAKTNKVLYESNEGLAPGKCDCYCTISPDGRYIAFWHDLTLSFYERETRLKLFEDSEYPSELMFSPSGNLFGFQHREDRVLRLWETQRRTFVPQPFVSIAKDWRLEALNDNYVIASITDTLHSTWEVWDVRTGAIVRRLELESTSMSTDGKFTFSPNGEYLLRSEDNKRWIWNISTGEITKRFMKNSYTNGPALIALSPDSKYIAFAMPLNGTMHVLAWDALDQEEADLNIIERKVECVDCRGTWLKGQHLLKVHGSTFTLRRGYLQVYDTTRMSGFDLDFQADFSNWPLVEVSPEDNHWSIAYVNKLRADLLCLWNIDEKKEFILDRSVEKITALAFSAIGDRLISGDSKGNIKIWDVRTRQLISHGGLSEGATALTFSPMGTSFWVAYETDEEPFIEERECSGSQNIVNGPFTHNSTNCSISLFSNDAYISVCAANPCDRFFKSYDLLLLDRSTGSSIGCFNTTRPAISSKNRRYIAWIPERDPKKVELWDVEKGIAPDEHPFDDKVTEFAFSNDSTRMCILGDVGKMGYHVDIWDIEAKGLVMQLFFSNFEFEWTSGSCMALCGDSLLLLDKYGEGVIWDLHVHEIMTRLYDNNLHNSRSGRLPGHIQTRRLIDDYRLRSANTGVLDSALVAWNKASFSPWTTLSEDGWMLSPSGQLLFWVPQKMRSGLFYPRMSFTTYKKPTKLNFDKFVHGTRWTECGK